MIEFNLLSWKKTKSVLSRYAVLMLSITVALSLLACGSNEEQPLRATSKDLTVNFDTVYGKLEFPQVLSDKIRHVETVEGKATVESFYMVLPRGEFEIFRIYYGDETMGSPMGYLTTENGVVPISYAVCDYLESDFPDEEEKNLYFSMMDAFSIVLNSIHSDERFSETKAVAVVDSQEVNLRYWSVELPENVQYEESAEGDTYRVDFYGQLGGERINLYTIGFEIPEAESTIGMFMADGIQKPVMVQTYGLDKYEAWSEEDRMVLFEMMDSLNSVISVIMANENFVQENLVE